jgi:CubicO group peptidase (beta-lactamase class C family)
LISELILGEMIYSKRTKPFMKYLYFFLVIGLFISCQKDDPEIEDPIEEIKYFPPLSGSDWSTIDTDSLGWNAEAMEELKSFMVETKSRAIIILKDGKIAFEHYEGNGILGTPYDKSSIWYWASAGKTLTSFLVGQAQEDGFLDINDSSSDYLGEGWTSLDATSEAAISVRHQLTMTTGLDDKAHGGDCTDPGCLVYLANPSDRWAYHNAPYTRLDGVIEGATGEPFDDYFNRELKSPIGMDGFWTYLDYNHVYWSTARSMARFGLLNLNEGDWDGQKLLGDKEYYSQMTRTSQSLNKSYGYLWWLNGKPSYMLPGLQLVLPGNIADSAPTDMVSGIGKNGQIVSIVPSENLVVVRMGENPDLSLVPIVFVHDLWVKINAITGQ